MGVANVDDTAWQVAARDWFVAELDGPRMFFAVAEIDGQVVAGAMATLRFEAPSPLTPAGVNALVANVATLPEFRGRGLARACTQEVVRWVREETDAAQVDLFATGMGAGLYESLGFREVAWPAMRLLVPRG